MIFFRKAQFWVENWLGLTKFNCIVVKYSTIGKLCGCGLRFRGHRNFPLCQLDVISVKICEYMAPLNCPCYSFPLHEVTFVLRRFKVRQGIVFLTNNCVRQLRYQIRVVKRMSRNLRMWWATLTQRLRNGSYKLYTND